MTNPDDHDFGPASRVYSEAEIKAFLQDNDPLSETCPCHGCTAKPGDLCVDLEGSPTSRTHDARNLAAHLARVRQFDDMVKQRRILQGKS